MKSHYETLDGLRGMAAFGVLGLHVCDFFIDSTHNPFKHAYLAVDFFFALSGFVMGHAYDNRLRAAPDQRLTFKGYLLRRVIRLHPLVILSVVLGLLSFILDPFCGQAQAIGSAVSWKRLTLVFLMGLLLLPAPSLPNHEDETHSLNGPSWTLFWEYVAYLFYGLIGYRLSVKWLAGLAVISAGLLIAAGLHLGELFDGFNWSTIWVAPIRLAYPFLAGLLVYRLQVRLKIKHAFLWLSLALLLLFAAPVFPILNGLYAALCTIILFPLFLCIGAGEEKLNGWIGAVCRLFGRLSYPVYILHYPLLYWYGDWTIYHHPSHRQAIAVAIPLTAGIIAVSWLALKYIDEPVRAWLSHRLKAT